MFECSKKWPFVETRTLREAGRPTRIRRTTHQALALSARAKTPLLKRPPRPPNGEGAILVPRKGRAVRRTEGPITKRKTMVEKDAKGGELPGEWLSEAIISFLKGERGCAAVSRACERRPPEC